MEVTPKDFCMDFLRKKTQHGPERQELNTGIVLYVT